MVAPIYINGRFLTQGISGVQRYAREIVKNLDELAPNSGREWILAAPKGAILDFSLENIRFETFSPFSGHAWEQLTLSRRTIGCPLINLCNSAPLFRRRSVVVIHDAAVFDTPENFSPLYRLVHAAIGAANAKFGRLGTVSNFSKRRIELALRPTREIFVASNGSDHHLSDVGEKPDIGLDSGEFFLCIGSVTKNKNIEFLVNNFAEIENRSVKLVVVGAAHRTFSTLEIEAAENIIFAGRLPDRNLEWLYANCVALIFPSLYEGFGIPPLEAMSRGCAVVASNIEPVVEVCGDSIFAYFDPRDGSSLRYAITAAIKNSGELEASAIRGRKRASKFTWKAGAEEIFRRSLEL